MLITMLAMMLAGAQPATAAKPAETTAVQQDRIAAGRQLIGLMKLDAAYDQMFTQLTPVFAQAVIGIMQSDPATRDSVRAFFDRGEGGQARFVAILSEEFMTSMRARYPEMKEQTAVEYARVFTLPEIRELIAFYSSGAGSKSLTAMPDLQRRLSAVGQEIGRKAGEEAGRRAFNRAEKEMLPQKPATKS